MAPQSTTETTAHSSTETTAHSTMETTAATLCYGRYYQKATYQEELRKSSHDTYLQSQSNCCPGRWI
jgi:hypothetical protein